MARSTIPGAGTGGPLQRTVPRIVTACSTIVAMSSSAAIATAAGSSGTLSGVLGRPSSDFELY